MSIQLSNLLYLAISNSNDIYSLNNNQNPTSSIVPTTTTQSFKNKIINGNAFIDQRNAGAPVVIAQDGTYFGPDRFVASISTTSPSPSYILQQQALSSSDMSLLGGLRNSVRLTSTNTNVIQNADGNVSLQYTIEGFDSANFNWGTTNGTHAAFSMWMKTNITGMHSVAFTNQQRNACYVATFPLSANTWSNIKLVIPPPSSTSTWDRTSNIGIRIDIDATCQACQVSSNDTWNYGSFMISASNYNSNIWTQNANFIEVTGLQLEMGSNITPYENRNLPMEIDLCHRYFEKSFPINVVPSNNLSSVAPGVAMMFANQMGVQSVTFETDKARVPQITFYNPSNGVSGALSTNGNSYPLTATFTSVKGTRINSSDAGINGTLGSFNWSSEAEFVNPTP